MLEIKNFIKENYNINNINNIYKKGKVYIIETEKETYTLKSVNNNAFKHNIRTLDKKGLETFVAPLYTKNEEVISTFNGQKMYLTPWINKDETQHKEKVVTLINKVLDMHIKTSYEKKVDDDFLKRELKYINDSMMSKLNVLESFAREYEVKEFRTPFEWHFIMNYHRVYEIFKVYNKSMENYKNKIKENKNMLFCVIHGKPITEHLIESGDKEFFISMDKIRTSIPIFDISLIFANYGDEAIEWNKIINDIFNYYNNAAVNALFFIITSWLLISRLNMQKLNVNTSFNSMEIYTNHLKKVTSLISCFNNLSVE